MIVAFHSRIWEIVILASSVCPLMNEDKRLVQASWWKGLAELAMRKTALRGGTMPSKSLIQLSADGWGCAPSLLIACPEATQSRVYRLCNGAVGSEVKSVKSVSPQSCPNLCDPMDCSLLGSSVQARGLEWVAISFSRGSSQPRDWTWVSRIIGRCFTIWLLAAYYPQEDLCQDVPPRSAAPSAPASVDQPMPSLETLKHARHVWHNFLWGSLLLSPGPWYTQCFFFFVLFKSSFPPGPCRMPRLGSLMWGLEPLQQWENFFDINCSLVCGLPPGEIGVWF